MLGYIYRGWIVYEGDVVSGGIFDVLSFKGFCILGSYWNDFGEGIY